MSLNINLEPQEVQTVLAGLGEIQLKNGLDLWLKIRNQAEQQLHAQHVEQQAAAEAAQKSAEAAAQTAGEVPGTDAPAA